MVALSLLLITNALIIFLQTWMYYVTDLSVVKIDSEKLALKRKFNDQKVVHKGHEDWWKHRSVSLVLPPYAVRRNCKPADHMHHQRGHICFPSKPPSAFWPPPGRCFLCIQSKCLLSPSRTRGVHFGVLPLAKDRRLALM